MCRNIKTLFNFDPPVTADEIRAASLQFVRKISGFNKPSKANEASFLAAVDEIYFRLARQPDTGVRVTFPSTLRCPDFTNSMVSAGFVIDRFGCLESIRGARASRSAESVLRSVRI